MSVYVGIDVHGKRSQVAVVTGAAAGVGQGEGGRWLMLVRCSDWPGVRCPTRTPSLS